MALTGPDTGDDGSVPAAVAVALSEHRDGQLGIAGVVAVLAAARLLVPLLEVSADQLPIDDAEPCAGTDRAVAVVSLTTATGRTALAFTGMGPMMSWDRRARPLPVDASRVARAALAEGASALLLDPVGPTPIRLGQVALTRLATGEPWPAPWADPAVRDAVAMELAAAITSGELAVRLAPGGREHPDALTVELAFDGAPAGEAPDRRAAAVAARLSGSAALREVFDGLLAVRILTDRPGS